MIEISMALSEAVRYQKQRDTALRIIGEISNVQSAWVRGMRVRSKF